MTLRKPTKYRPPYPGRTPPEPHLSRNLNSPIQNITWPGPGISVRLLDCLRSGLTLVYHRMSYQRSALIHKMITFHYNYTDPPRPPQRDFAARPWGGLEGAEGLYS